MTLLRSTVPVTSDAIRLLSAMGDALGAHPIGFSLRVANVAANFAVQRGCDPETLAATYFAAALHEIGSVRIMIPEGTSERETIIARWDAPPEGARMADAISALPHATGDYIRWHRESFDGTGFPDRLRWNGIPHAAMAINISRAFVLAIFAQGRDSSPAEALFDLFGEAGRTYSTTVVRELRTFFASAPDRFDAPYESTWPLTELDGNALVRSLCTAVDARSMRTQGRGDRMERTVTEIVKQLGDRAIDVASAAFAARLFSLGRLVRDSRVDDFDPLARLGREARAAQAAGAAAIVASAPDYAAFGPILAASSEWYDGTGLPRGIHGTAIHPIARVLAVASAAEDLRHTNEAPVRITAAAGKQFDPEVVGAYMATLGGKS